MQETIRDAAAQDFTQFPLHGYRQVRSPRDTAYLSNVVEPTAVLRVANLNWVRGRGEGGGFVGSRRLSWAKVGWGLWCGVVKHLHRRRGR